MDIIKEYQALGFVVMPIRKDDKIPMLKNWSQFTKDDNDWLYDEFEKAPDSNVGIIMGECSNVICLDIDVKKVDGVATLKDLESKYGELPQTVMSETPSGGIHYYFKYVDGIVNRKKIGDGIDVQGNGTQTLEYPSSVNGDDYEWVYDPFEYDIAELPKEWLVLLGDGSEDGGITLSKPLFEPPEEVSEGSRNNTLASYIGSQIGKKIKKESLIKKILKYNEEHCDPPLDKDEVLTTIESMLKTHERNTREKINEVVEKEEDKATVKDWLYISESGEVTINEIKFAKWYVKSRQIYCVNEKLYDEYGVKSDAWFRNDIQNLVGSFIVQNVARRVSSLLDVIKNEAFTSIGLPPLYKIAFENAYYDVEKGKLNDCDSFFTLNRIPHKHEPSATCPTWLRFIDGLFEESDIPVIQEYLGYLLIPNTLAQTSLFIHGEGGEGKSRITSLMEHILGENNLVIGDFKGLQDKFSMSSLERQMLFIDDDLSLDALNDTSNFKKIVTAETSMEVEPKGKPKYKTKLYSRILCCGNGAPQSKFDHSDGFYRRQLICKVKPVPKDRIPDRKLSEKLKNETPGIINWLIEGLLRVVNNGFII